MQLSKLAQSLGQKFKGAGQFALRVIYPPFCAHCHLQLDKDELLCVACLSQLELECHQVRSYEFSIFMRSPVALSLVRQLSSVQGMRLVKGVAGYAALQLVERGALKTGFYVQKGFEDLGRAIEDLIAKPFLGTFRPKRDNSTKADIILADFEAINLKQQMVMKKRGLRCIYLVGQSS